MSTMIQEIEFAPDSPLEGSGFEPLVPRPCKPIRSFGPAALQADPISAVCDHDFAKMPATFEMAVCLVRLGERECPIDHGAQAVHRDCPVHGLEIDPTSDADRTERNSAAG